MNEIKVSEADIEIKKAAQLSITEIGLGSIGHSFKIPLTGHLLSLNQLGFLLNATNQDRLPKSSVFEISAISAVLKSLSPAGPKIGPMLSIAMQGFLFWLSLTVLGANLIGQCVGAVLLSLWAFVQPLLTLFFIYGFDLAKLAEYYVQRVRDDYSFVAMTLFYVMIGVLIAKAVFALAMVISSVYLKKEIKIFDSLQKEKFKVAPVVPVNTPFKSALGDLFRPLFLFSFTLMLIFIWQLNGSLVEKIWLSLRPIATAFILFYLLRSPWASNRLFEYSKKSKAFGRIYEKSRKAFEIISKDSTKN